MKPYAALLSVMAVCAVVTAPCRAVAAAGGLSSRQLQDLRALPFAVVPEPPPAGFTVQSLTIDRNAKTYDIRYRGPHGATMDVRGHGTKGAQPAANAPPQHHGLFQNIGNALSHLTSHATNSASLHGASNEANANANDQSGKAGEEQEEMTGVGAFNSTLGPVNFQQSGSCLNGTNDPSRAQIHDAAFTISGCNMHAPDAVIRAYKALAPIH
ncbi:MAG: hypothetical protein JO322_12340 [Candidatus Eremiobacteraeota bacterium]|nr:hypothetical protein [Candidatus Eremiobacteraeota bacterium]